MDVKFWMEEERLTGDFQSVVRVPLTLASYFAMLFFFVSKIKSKNFILNIKIVLNIFK
jgi:hypothetical protein